MNMSKLRLRLQNGMEFEAEGATDFIEAQKGAFFELAASQKACTGAAIAKTVPAELAPPPQHPGFEPGIWKTLMESRDNLFYLKTRYPQTEPHDAALMILATWTELGKKGTVEALKLAKSLKKSGFVKGRLDRIMAQEISQQRIISTGTKRARRYQLTAEGLARAHYLAQDLLPSHPEIA